MRKRGYAVLIAWLMTLGGCHVVYSTTPVGSQAVAFHGIGAGRVKT